jgi:hypothetical protein
MIMHLSRSTPIAAESGTYSHAPAGPGYRCSRPPPFVVGEAIRHDTSRITSPTNVVSELNVKAFAMRQSSTVSEYANVRLAPFRMASPAELNPDRLDFAHYTRVRTGLRRCSALLPLFPAFASQLSLFSAPGTELVAGGTIRQISRDESLHFIPIASSLPHTASRISQFSVVCGGRHRSTTARLGP